MTGNEFTVAHERSEDGIVLVLRGELDMTTAPLVEAAVDEAANDGADGLSLIWNRWLHRLLRAAFAPSGPSALW
jgi:hypothetical protein